jgi:hypothetical protein
VQGSFYLRLVACLRSVVYCPRLVVPRPSTSPSLPRLSELSALTIGNRSSWLVSEINSDRMKLFASFVDAGNGMNLEQRHQQHSGSSDNGNRTRRLQ